jgi:hypothetical protein
LTVKLLHANCASISGIANPVTSVAGTRQEAARLSQRLAISPRNVSIEMPVARHCNTPSTERHQNYRRIYHRDMTIMNSLSTGHASSPPTSSGAETLAAAVPTDAVDRASANADTSASFHDEKDPLWLIAAAMAVFFAVAAAFLAAG